MSVALDHTSKLESGRLLIDGNWTEALSGKTFQTVDPATEEVLAEVAEADSGDVDLAVAAARTALEDGSWGTMDARDRGRALLRLAALIDEHRQELARLETLDNGKPVGETANVDVPRP